MFWFSVSALQNFLPRGRNMAEDGIFLHPVAVSLSSRSFPFSCADMRFSSVLVRFSHKINRPFLIRIILISSCYMNYFLSKKSLFVRYLTWTKYCNVKILKKNKSPHYFFSFFVATLKHCTKFKKDAERFQLILFLPSPTNLFEGHFINLTCLLFDVLHIIKLIQNNKEMFKLYPFVSNDCHAKSHINLSILILIYHDAITSCH